MNWHVIYTKPKWEKKVAEQLNKAGIIAYCPTTIVVKERSDRKKKMEVPLFNHYVFVYISAKDRNAVFISPGVIRYLYWLGKHALVTEKEIDTIKNWLNPLKNNIISIESYSVGQTITVTEGPFKTQNAIVKEITKTHHILVLKTLGCILKIKHS